MYRAGFPGCCAGYVLYNFGGTALTSGNKAAISPKEIKKWIKSHSDDQKFYLVAVNTEQNKFMAPILKELKFKCVGKNIKSPGHLKSGVFLYLKATYK